MATIGKVQDVTREFIFEWSIENFFSLAKEEGASYGSSSFSFAGESWYLKIYPNGDLEDDSVGCIGVYLHRNRSDTPMALAWSLVIKTFDGKKDHEAQFTYVFRDDDGYGTASLLERSMLFEKKSELVPSGVLTIVCTVEFYSKSRDDAGKTLTVKCSYCKEPVVAECASSHAKKCLAKPMRCPTCGSVVALRYLIYHECDTTKVKATEKLVGDFADILESGEQSDVTIRVKHKEFRLHRSILSARNPYFSSMFKSEMKEKNTGIVSIEDCEPDIFHSFINFVYTGKAHRLSCDNVCVLYEVADQYQQNQLKAECVCYMKNKISVDSFVDFIVLALKHDDKELLQATTDLFCRKTKEIIQSVKWQKFMREYPTEANELHIKFLDYNAK